MQGDAAIAIFLEILADLFVQKRIAIHSASESAESLPFVVSNKQKHLCVTIKKVRCYTWSGQEYEMKNSFFHMLPKKGSEELKFLAYVFLIL